MYQLKMYEHDTIVGNADAAVLREYPIASFDTLSHAHRVTSEHDTALAARTAAVGGESRQVTGASGTRGTRTEHTVTVVKRNHPHDYGTVYRTTWLQIVL